MGESGKKKAFLRTNNLIQANTTAINKEWIQPMPNKVLYNQFT